MAVGTIYPDSAPGPIQDLSQRVAAIEEGGGSGGDGTVTAANITDASAVGRTVLKAADAAAARTAIGAGTSSLAVGTSAAQAAAGNHNHVIAVDAASGLAAYANLQAAFVGLSARIKALEDAAV